MNQSKYTASLESMTGNLHLWDLPSTQVGIKESKTIHYAPLTSINNTDTITFNIPGTPKLFLDSVEIITDVKITNIPADKQLSVVSNLANSLWKNVSVIIGGVNITQSFDNAYAISTFIETVLNNSPDREDILLFQTGFLMDKADSKSDSENYTIYKVEATGNDPARAVKNHAAARRIERFTTPTGEPTSKVAKFTTPLAVSLFQQHKLLPDNLDIQIGLTKGSKHFCLLGPENTTAVLEIANVYLKVHYKIPVDEAIEGIELRLQKEPARFEADEKRVTFRHFPPGIHKYKINNLFTGKLPKYFVAAINDRAAYGNKAHRNPWTFWPIKAVQCWVNGESYFPKEVEGVEELFNAYQEAIGYQLLGRSLITPENFHIHNLLPTSLTADRSTRGNHLNLINTGVVDLEIELPTASSDDFVLIVYAIYDRVIEIDGSRQIHIV